MTNGQTSTNAGHIAPEDFHTILAILKVLGNRPRLQILLLLKNGEQTFQMLLHTTMLQKTALANHLTQLLETGLISKPDHGKYALNPDGALFLKAILTGYDQSLARGRAAAVKIASGSLSETFLKDFFRDH